MGIWITFVEMLKKILVFPSFAHNSLLNKKKVFLGE